jgi:enoyl-CoA hydratase
MANQMVTWEVKESIGTITLNRPEKRNAINEEMLEGINKAFSELSLSLEAKVILLQGAGPAFSAGVDFNYLAATAQDDGRALGIRLREVLDAIQTILNRIERIEKPVVAKIHGFCGGSGWS